jgi:hypothetical protein
VNFQEPEFHCGTDVFQSFQSFHRPYLLTQATTLDTRARPPFSRSAASLQPHQFHCCTLRQVGALYDAPEDGEEGGADFLEGPSEDEPVVVIPFAEACGTATSAAEEDESDEQEHVGGRDVEGGHTPWLRAGVFAWAVSGSSQVKIAPL